MKHQAPQGGFSLIELLVALVIVTILATAISGAFDGSRTRAQTLITQMTDLGSANVRLKNDTGCYVKVPNALFDPTSANDSSHNYCNRTFGKVWNGPYVNRFTADAAGAAKMDKVSAESLVSFEVENAGLGKRYFTHATNIPNDIVKQAVQACNDSDNMAVTTFDQQKCRGALDSAPGVGTFDMMYDETR